jgi:hypothetical protein
VKGCIPGLVRIALVVLYALVPGTDLTPKTSGCSQELLLKAGLTTISLDVFLKMTAATITDITEILLKVALNTINQPTN